MRELFMPKSLLWWNRNRIVYSRFNLNIDLWHHLPEMKNHPRMYRHLIDIKPFVKPVTRFHLATFPALLVKLTLDQLFQLFCHFISLFAIFLANIDYKYLFVNNISAFADIAVYSFLTQIYWTCVEIWNMWKIHKMCWEINWAPEAFKSKVSKKTGLIFISVNCWSCTGCKIFNIRRISVSFLFTPYASRFNKKVTFLTSRRGLLACFQVYSVPS